MPIVALLLVLAALAGCAPPPLPVAYYSPPPPAATSRWQYRCSFDRFENRNKCEIRLALEQLASPPIIAGSLSTGDLGRSWSIVSSPLPVTARLKVDQAQTIALICHGISCVLSPAQSRALTAALRTGQTIAVELTTVNGQLNQDLPVEGYRLAVTEVTARLQAPPPPR